MNKNKLEEFIKNNKEKFDLYDPSPEVWNRISVGNKKGRKVKLRMYILRAAAVIVVAVISSAVLWQVIRPGSINSVSAADPELQELIDAEAFYAHQVNAKLDEIRKCYFTFPELKDEVETDLIELEEMYNVLKTDLQENISSKTVIEAMIENNRYRLKLVDDVLEQINC